MDEIIASSRDLLITLVVTVVIPALGLWLKKTLKGYVDEQQVDALIAEAVGYAQEQGRQARKQNAPLPGHSKKGIAQDYVVREARQRRLKPPTGSVLSRRLDAEVGRLKANREEEVPRSERETDPGGGPRT